MLVYICAYTRVLWSDESLMSVEMGAWKEQGGFAKLRLYWVLAAARARRRRSEACDGEAKGFAEARWFSFDSVEARRWRLRLRLTEVRMPTV